MHELIGSFSPVQGDIASFFFYLAQQIGDVKFYKNVPELFWITPQKLKFCIRARSLYFMDDDPHYTPVLVIIEQILTKGSKNQS